MNWRKEAENELREYKRAQNLVDLNEELVNELRREGGECAATDASDEDKLKMRARQIEELEMQAVIARRHVELVQRGLRSLTPEEQRILAVFYIERPKGFLEMLCCELGYEQSNLYNRKNTALRNFTIAIFGLIDS